MLLKETINSEEFLLQAKKYDVVIANKLDEIRRLEALADNISPILTDIKVASSHDPRRIQKAWDRVMCARDELAIEVDAALRAKKKVTDALEKLSSLEYDVLYRIYISHFSLQKVADDLHYTRQAVYAIKQRGLEHLQNILDSR